MNIPRRRLLRLATAALALPALPRAARAQAYPAHPLRWLVGYPAGGSADIIARIIGQYLTEKLGQPVIVENRPGAGNNIATEAVARSAADGYTLLLVNPANAINATLYAHLSFDFLKDIEPVAAFMQVPNIAEVHPSVPVKTFPELIAYCKANPGKVNMASGGNGVPSHLAGELFKMMADVNVVHVPYRGSAPALTDLLAGQVQMMFDPLPTSIEHIKAGRLRALAVTTAKRSEFLPDLPTVSQFLPGYEASTWYGLGVPTGTPVAVMDQLNKLVNDALADPAIKQKVANLGGTVIAGTRDDLRKRIVEETGKWGKVIRTAGIKTL